MEDIRELQDDLSAVVENVNQEITETVEEIVDVKAVEETAETVAEEVAEKIEPFKVFETEDEFNKVLQSTSGKAKGDILKELGINSVNEFKEQYSKVEELTEITNTLSEVQSRVESLAEEKLKLESIVLSAKYPMSDDASRMFAELVSVKRGDRDLIEVADEVYNTLQSGFKQLPTKVVFGAERAPEEPKSEVLKAFEKGLGL